MYKVSIAIMHHPDRKMWLDDILARLNVDATVIEGSGAGLSNVWDTAELAWSSFQPDATHHLVLQDDILLCKDFMKTVERLVRLKPNALLGFYHNKTKLDLKAKEENIRWIQYAAPTASVALLMPVEQIMNFLVWQTHFVNCEYPHDDGRLCLWLNQTKALKSFFTVPTLVEHIASSKSTVGHSNKNKVSTWFVGINRSGLFYDWTCGIDAPIKSSLGYPSANAKKALKEKYAEKEIC